MNDVHCSHVFHKNEGTLDLHLVTDKGLSSFHQFIG